MTNARRCFSITSRRMISAACLPRPSHFRKVLQVIHSVPVNWRIAEENTKLAFTWQSRVDRAHHTKELLVDWRIPRRMRLGRVLPHLTKRFIRDVIPATEPIHDVLITRITEFDDDVIDSGRESGVANKGEPKSMALLVTVSALTEGDHRVRTKGVENALDRLDCDGGSWSWTLLHHRRRRGKGG